MVRPRQAERIPGLDRRIKAAAWRQIEKQGAAGVSLRGIARTIGIAAPSIYNYYPTREALVTALAVEAFKSLADDQRRSIAHIPERDPKRRLLHLGLSYRDWAIRHPQRYQLIFGTPIPDHVMRPEMTMPPSAWALLPLIETLQALTRRGQLRSDRLPRRPGMLDSIQAAWRASLRSTGAAFDPEVLYLAYVIWTRVHGLVSLELGHQTPAFIARPAEIYRREIDGLLTQYLQEHGT